MAQAHAIGAVVVFATMAAAALATAVAALLGGRAWVERARRGVLIVIGLEVVVGGATYLAGGRPTESLHFLYAVGLLALLPLAATFAAEAPPRPRAWVMAVALGVGLLLLWRLSATG